MRYLCRNQEAVRERFVRRWTVKHGEEPPPAIMGVLDSLLCGELRIAVDVVSIQYEPLKEIGPMLLGCIEELQIT